MVMGRKERKLTVTLLKFPKMDFKGELILITLTLPNIYQNQLFGDFLCFCSKASR